MRALILAAGKGTRLGLLTRTTPKALMEIGGETLIGRLIRQCAAAGVDCVHVVVGHEAERIRQALSATSQPVTIDYVPNPSYDTTNNIVSLSLGLKHLRDVYDGDLLLIECDVVLEDGVLSRFVAEPASDVTIVSPYRLGMDGTVVRLDGHHVGELVTTAQQGPFFRYEDTFKTVNVYKLSHHLWSSKLLRLLDWYVEEVSSRAYYENAIGMITYASSDALTGMIIEPEAWREIDDPNDLRVARTRFSAPALASEIDRSHGGWWDLDVVDFAYLRNMHFPRPALIAQLREHIEEAIHHYGSSQAVLDEKMSWFIETRAEHTLALGGLSTLYPLLTDALDRPDALIPSPTFGEYGRCFPHAAVYDPRITIAAIAERVALDRPRHVVIVNPNNPTGTLRDSDGLAALAAEQPGTTFWVDESFIAFTDQPSLRQLDGTPDNVVVLASLSKDLGVPGLRLGFAWSRDPAVLERLRAQLPIWAISSLAEIFLTLALKFKEDFALSLQRTAEDKAAFESTLSAVAGLRLLPDVYGNFILAEAYRLPEQRAQDLVTMLRHERFEVREVGRRLGSDHPVLRIAVRTRDENARLAEVLGACLARLSAT